MVALTTNHGTQDKVLTNHVRPPQLCVFAWLIKPLYNYSYTAHV